MNAAQMMAYRDRLWQQIGRLQRDASSVSQQAFGPIAGQVAGERSNAPTHPGDVGTEAYLLELNATLLENEEYLVKECLAAARRIAEGEFGRCENCGRQIARARLDAIPFTRHCTPCAEVLDPGPQINLNAGRPDDRFARLPSPNTGRGFASHLPGGGTAFGGPAGCKAGKGKPTAKRQDAMGSGDSDIDETSPADGPQAGRAGVTVRGTPAGKRARNGNRHRAKRPRRR
jgi:RNA polymerase-binding transcription factor DksA